jgi:transposase
MIAGFTVTTLKQSDNPPSGKAPRHQGQKKARQVKSNLKSMIITFFDIKGFVHKEFAPTGRTVNSGSTAKFCGDCVKKCEDIAPKFVENTWLLHHDNAPSHTSVLTHQFLAKNKIAVIPHPPYSPDLAPCDFLLFPKMKLKLKGRRFDTIEEIQVESQRVHDTLTEKDFQEAFQKLRRRWDRCLHAGGNY